MKSLKFAFEFHRRKFTGATTKDAYMKAMKWYASNVIAKGRMHDVQVEIKKIEDEPSVVIALYAILDEGEQRKNFCNVCKEVNKLFYIDKKKECSECSVKEYMDRLDQKMSIKTGLYKEIMKKTGGDKK